MIAFPQLHEPAGIRSMSDSKPRYSISIMFPVNDDHAQTDWKEVVLKNMQKLAREIKGPKFTFDQYKAMDKPIKSGAELDPSKYSSVYINSNILTAYAQADTILQFFDADPSREIPQDQIKIRFQNGTLCSVAIDFYIAKSFPNRICCGFQAVQWVGKGQPFGMGYVDGQSVFDKYDTSDAFDQKLDAPKAVINDDDTAWG